MVGVNDISSSSWQLNCTLPFIKKNQLFYHYFRKKKFYTYTTFIKETCTLIQQNSLDYNFHKNYNDLSNVKNFHLIDDMFSITNHYTIHRLGIKSTFFTLINYNQFANVFYLAKIFYTNLQCIAEFKIFTVANYTDTTLQQLYFNQIQLHDDLPNIFLYKNGQDAIANFQQITMARSNDLIDVNEIIATIERLWNIMRTEIIKFMYFMNVYIIDFFKYDKCMLEMLKIGKKILLK